MFRAVYFKQSRKTDSDPLHDLGFIENAFAFVKNHHDNHLLDNDRVRPKLTLRFFDRELFEHLQSATGKVAEPVFEDVGALALLLITAIAFFPCKNKGFLYSGSSLVDPSKKTDQPVKSELWTFLSQFKKMKVGYKEQWSNAVGVMIQFLVGDCDVMVSTWNNCGMLFLLF